VNVTGRYELGAPREAVFAAICDPGSLLDIIPGCQEIRRVSDTEYQGRISIRLPAMVGSYATVVRLVDTDPPAFGRMEGTVEGGVGSITGDAVFRLTEAGPGTLLEYEAHGTIGGPLARLDSRFVEGLAKSLINEGLGKLDRRLAGRGALETMP
jgi:hypothetical protein